MKSLRLLALCLLPSSVFAGDIAVTDAWVPLAPPTATVHAVFFTLSNTGTAERMLVGVRAAGYAMAELHRSTITDGIATMTAVDIVTVAPGQTVAFEHGALHVMLMKPAAPIGEGQIVPVMLDFADGTTLSVEAKVMKLGHAGHGS